MKEVLFLSHTIKELFAVKDFFFVDGLLHYAFELKNKSTFDDLINTWSTRLLSMIIIFRVVFPVFANEFDCATTSMCGVQIEIIALLAHDEYSTSSWATQELMWRDVHTINEGSTIFQYLT